MRACLADRRLCDRFLIDFGALRFKRVKCNRDKKQLSAPVAQSDRWLASSPQAVGSKPGCFWCFLNLLSKPKSELLSETALGHQHISSGRWDPAWQTEGCGFESCLGSILIIVGVKSWNWNAPGEEVRVWNGLVVWRVTQPAGPRPTVLLQ